MLVAVPIMLPMFGPLASVTTAGLPWENGRVGTSESAAVPGNVRIAENGDVRITEDGQERIVE